MTVEYEAVTVGVVAIAAVLTWSNIRIWKRMRAIDAQLAKMQKKIDILQMQESRRLMMALKANSKVEAPGIDPDNGPVEDGRVEVDSGGVVRLMKTPPTTPA
jgi:hypothetical protein